jgi:hypothetical protein
MVDIRPFVNLYSVLCVHLLFIQAVLIWICYANLKKVCSFILE